LTFHDPYDMILEEGDEMVSKMRKNRPHKFRLDPGYRRTCYYCGRDRTHRLHKGMLWRLLHRRLEFEGKGPHG
jgi:hypothetical protein